jgi:hypothetical protein
MQEGSQRCPAMDRSGTVYEDKEGRLKHVLGSVGIVQDPATDVEDHRSVPADEGRERLVTAPREKLREELFVGRHDAGKAPDVLQEDGGSQHGETSGEKAFDVPS